MVRIAAAILALGIVSGLGFALVSGTQATAPTHIAASTTPGTQS
jgi:hypothetical protein